MSYFLALCGVVAVIAATFLFIRYVGFRLIYDYEASAAGVIFFVFRSIRVWKIPYEDITEVRPVTWNNPASNQDISLFTLKLGNRLEPRFVLLRRASGFVRELHVTPSDPDGFISTVASHIGRRTSR
jgi:hypothetical protein